jgi:hypothetical protein
MTNRMFIGSLVLTMLVLLLGACQPKPVGTETSQGYVPAFQVTGDVEQPLSFKSLDQFPNSGLESEISTSKAASLSEIIEMAVPAAQSYNVLLIGDDGLTAEVDGASISDCYLAFSEDNAWEAINPKHPVSSNIKRIKEIVVVSTEESTSFGLNIIGKTSNMDSITPAVVYTVKMHHHQVMALVHYFHRLVPYLVVGATVGILVNT